MFSGRICSNCLLLARRVNQCFAGRQDFFPIWAWLRVNWKKTSMRHALPNTDKNRGMGSVCILAELFASSARFFSWNSRGLLSSNPGRFKSKWALILNILPRVDILLIQETHGSFEQCTVVMAAIEHLFCRWFSPGPVERAGGLLTLVRRSGREKVSGETFHEIVQGRCHAVELVIKDSSSLTSGSLVIGNIHNDRRSLHEANAVSAIFERHVRRSQRKGPRFLTCLGWNWNLLEPGAVPLSIERLPL